MGRNIQIEQPDLRQIKPEVIIYTNLESDENKPPVFESFYDASEFLVQADDINNVQNILGSATVGFSATSHAGATPYSQSNLIHFLSTKITPMSIIIVKIDRHSFRPNFVGLVDNVYESIGTVNGNTQRMLMARCTLTISKLLYMDELPAAYVLQGNKIVERLLGEARTEFFKYYRGSENNDFSFAGTPFDAIKFILENAPATNILHYGLDRYFKTLFDGQLKEKIDKNTSGEKLLQFDFLDNEYLFAPELSVFHGKVIDYIRKCLDMDFYQIYSDSTIAEDNNAHNKLVIETKPFSYRELDSAEVQSHGWKYWEDLDTVIIDKNYKLNENVGISDYEVKNFFSTQYNMSLIANPGSSLGFLGAQFPIINFESVKKYGMRPLITKSNMLNIKDFEKKLNEDITNFKKLDETNLTPTEIEFIIEKRDKAYQWNVFDRFYSGTITAIGNVEFRIGRKLYLPFKKFFNTYTREINTGMEYYISAVRNTFRYPSDYKSILSVTRGQPPGFVAKWISQLESKKMKTGDPVILKINDLKGLKSTTINPIDTKEISDERDTTIDSMINGN